MKKRIIIAISTLIIGIIIYAISLVNVDNCIISILRNFVPDYLWTISFFFLSSIVMKNIVKRYIIATLVYVLCIGFLYEVLQLLGAVKGTFDIIDIFIYTAGVITACYMERKFKEDCYEKN